MPEVRAVAYHHAEVTVRAPRHRIRLTAEARTITAIPTETEAQRRVAPFPAQLTTAPQHQPLIPIWDRQPEDRCSIRHPVSTYLPLPTLPIASNPTLYVIGELTSYKRTQSAWH